MSVQGARSLKAGLMVFLANDSVGNSTRSHDSIRAVGQQSAGADVNCEISLQNAFAGPLSAVTALPDSLAENARCSRMVVGSYYPTVFAWSLSGCCSVLMVLFACILVQFPSGP